MPHSKFFRDMTDYVVVAKFYECERTVTIEELYQMFLSRMKAETEIFCNRITDKDA